jgi:hypothetical protein
MHGFLITVHDFIGYGSVVGIVSMRGVTTQDHLEFFGCRFSTIITSQTVISQGFSLELNNPFEMTERETPIAPLVVKGYLCGLTFFVCYKCIDLMALPHDLYLLNSDSDFLTEKRFSVILNGNQSQIIFRATGAVFLALPFLALLVWGVTGAGPDWL